MKISILIPCYNEEKTISACVDSCLNQTINAHEIVVVNDGSTDSTLQKLKNYGSKVKLVNLESNSGSKGKAQEKGMEKVTGDIVVMTDADTLLDKGFLESIYLRFLDDKIDVITGNVKSLSRNWITALRDIDYTVGHDLYKRAQSEIGSVFVASGCASAFRKSLFGDVVTFDNDTITEDLDFTYKLNQAGKKIVFEPNAIVYTQDPSDLYSYVNQMRRWYGGQWQNLKKNASGIKRPIQVFLYTLVHAESIYYPFILFMLPFFDTSIRFLPLVYLSLYSIFAGMYSSWRRARIDLLVYSPLYILLFYLHSYICVEQFVKEYVLGFKNMHWFKPVRRVIS